MAEKKIFTRSELPDVIACKRCKGFNCAQEFTAGIIHILCAAGRENTNIFVYKKGGEIAWETMPKWTHVHLHTNRANINRFY